RFTVDSRAAAHQVATQGFADPDTEISQGTFELRQGNGDVTTITIDESNNSLSGLADAINAVKGSVTANVIKDSSGGSSPYRLLLTSSKTGVENSISLTNNLAASSGNAVRPEVNFDTPVQAATDAKITFGSGGGAISTTSSTNHFEDVVRGVSFDLLNPDVGQEVTLTVGRDTATAVENVQSFVSSFNDTIQFINDQSRFISASAGGGPLLGDRNVQTIKQKLYAAVLDVVPGANQSANRLSSIGITIGNSGTLILDSSKLQNILNGQTEGVTATDVKRLFAIDGTSDNPGVTFVSGSVKTVASSTPIEVKITQPAEQAAVTSENAVASSIVIDGTNNSLTLNISGADATVTLAAGTYTRQGLADLLETTLNSATPLSGRSVSVGLDGSNLTITTASYGSTTNINLISGTALSDLGFTAGQTATGKDVRGSYVVNGTTEATTGRGQILSGNALNENTDGLLTRVTLTTASELTPATAQLTVSRGVGAGLGKLLDSIVSSSTGLAANTNTGYANQLTDLQKSMDRQQAIFDSQQTRLKAQFAALESAISSLQSTGNYVTQQLSSLSTLSK
ncbi:MAG: flagellar filament capping protein FliD, partial [Planctomycetaceae bacterium]|nr:flagellar filament capping protein FliD [Planctomycetaceae bacterium]